MPLPTNSINNVNIPPLERIALLQHVAKFSCKSGRQLAIFANVTSSWDECVRHYCIDRLLLKIADCIPPIGKGSLSVLVSRLIKLSGSAAQQQQQSYFFPSKSLLEKLLTEKVTPVILDHRNNGPRTNSNRYWNVVHGHLRETPLHLAARYHFSPESSSSPLLKEICEMVVEYATKRQNISRSELPPCVNQRGKRPIEVAGEVGNLEAVKTLTRFAIENKAMLTAEEQKNETKIEFYELLFGSEWIEKCLYAVASSQHQLGEKAIPIFEYFLKDCPEAQPFIDDIVTNMPRPVEIQGKGPRSPLYSELGILEDLLGSCCGKKTANLPLLKFLLTDPLCKDRFCINSNKYSRKRYGPRYRVRFFPNGPNRIPATAATPNFFEIHREGYRGDAPLASAIRTGNDEIVRYLLLDFLPNHHLLLANNNNTSTTTPKQHPHHLEPNYYPFRFITGEQKESGSSSSGPAGLPLGLCVETGNVACLKLLLDVLLKYDQEPIRAMSTSSDAQFAAFGFPQGNGLLHEAVRKQFPEIVKVLLEHPWSPYNYRKEVVDIYTCNKWASTPLHLAVSEGTLIESLQEKHGQQGKTWSQQARDVYLEIIKLLLEADKKGKDHFLHQQQQQKSGGGKPRSCLSCLNRMCLLPLDVLVLNEKLSVLMFSGSSGDMKLNVLALFQESDAKPAIELYKEAMINVWKQHAVDYRRAFPSNGSRLADLLKYNPVMRTFITTIEIENSGLNALHYAISRESENIWWLYISACLVQTGKASLMCFSDVPVKNSNTLHLIAEYSAVQFCCGVVKKILASDSSESCAEIRKLQTMKNANGETPYDVAKRVPSTAARLGDFDALRCAEG